RRRSPRIAQPRAAPLSQSFLHAPGSPSSQALSSEGAMVGRAISITRSGEDDAGPALHPAPPIATMARSSEAPPRRGRGGLGESGDAAGGGRGGAGGEGGAPSGPGVWGAEHGAPSGPGVWGAERGEPLSGSPRVSPPS